VAGQDHITETLRRQVDRGRLSHAYLLVGSRGTGKTSCARILARAVNCQNPEDGNPCNVCEFCVGIENGGILDVLELDAASNNGVDNVRALREEAVYSPASVRKRVYIIDEVHMLSVAAFNALLKLLEEPPEHLMFILATTELHKVPATILSRCQRFSFKRLAPDAISARLAKVAEAEGLTLVEDAAKKLAALADGSMRDGLSLLDQCAAQPIIDLRCVLDTIGLAGRGEVSRLAEAVADRALADALGILDMLYNDGRDLPSLLNELASLLRDTLVYKLSPRSPLISVGVDGEDLSRLAEKMSAERLFYCLDVIRDASQALSRSGGARLVTEMCLIRMCDERLSDSEAALTARLERLESSGGVSAPATPVPDKAASPVKPKDIAPVVMSENDAPPADTAPSVDDDPAPSAPVTAPVKAVGDETEDFWRGILKLLEGDPAIHTLLGDGAKVSANLKGGELVVRAKSPFIVQTIESKAFSDPLRTAAREVLGREVALRVETDGGGDEPGQGKLERLSAFDIVKFE